MALPWIRLDTTFYMNPKVLQLVSAEKWHPIVVYVAGLGYSGAQGTDGFIPRAALPFIHGDNDAAKQLVSVRLWQEDKAGWFMPDWAEFQQTVAQTESNLAAKRAASRKGNCVRWHGERCGCWREAPA